MECERIAVDPSKSVFTLHGVDERGRPILRRDLSRARFEEFLGKIPPTEVVLEACGSSHHGGRVAQALGHEARLIPPQYVKPFVKRGKNDRNDAEAIGEAASRPTMRSVPVKSAPQAQAEAMDLSARDLLVRQRTQLVNAVRGHAAEFGVIAAKGIAQVEPLLAKIAETDMPQAAKETLAHLGRCIEQLDAQLTELDRRRAARHKANPVSRRLAAVPGVGPLTALTVATTVDAGRFESARHFAAWLGLTPRERSTGGRQRLGGISRAGNERLRQLLVVGAMAVIRHAKPTSKAASPWLLGLLERRPRKLAAVALANKMARSLWAMMANGTAYRRPPQSA
jgi:transposase